MDEDAVQARYGVTDPHDTALLLARAKAEAVAALPEAEGALVLGCDSVFEFDGEAHGKPYTADVARERMLRMSGSMGVLHTGHWLVDCRDTDPDDDGEGAGTGATLGGASAEVHFLEMDPAEIDAYIATGEPLQCAGSFTIDGLGGAFIRKVDGDPHTVVGLSVSTLRGLLAPRTCASPTSGPADADPAVACKQKRRNSQALVASLQRMGRFTRGIRK